MKINAFTAIHSTGILALALGTAFATSAKAHDLIVVKPSADLYEPLVVAGPAMPEWIFDMAAPDYGIVMTQPGLVVDGLVVRGLNQQPEPAIKTILKQMLK